MEIKESKSDSRRSLLKACIAGRHLESNCSSNGCLAPFPIEIVVRKDDGSESNQQWRNVSGPGDHYMSVGINVPVHKGAAMSRVNVDFTQEDHLDESTSIIARYPTPSGACRSVRRTVQGSHDSSGYKDLANSILAGIREEYQDTHV